MWKSSVPLAWGMIDCLESASRLDEAWIDPGQVNVAAGNLAASSAQFKNGK
jgi:hypothetical protein